MREETTILIVDRDTHAYETVFRKSSWQVDRVTSLSACFRILKKKSVHLLLIELQLLQDEGVATLNTLFHESTETNVMLSGTCTPTEILSQVYSTGQNVHFIEKTWEHTRIRDTVDSALKQSASKSSSSENQAPVKGAVGEMQYLHRISQKISEKKPLPRLLKEIMESSKHLLEAEASSLLLYDREDKKLHFQVATGEKGKLIKKFSVNIGQGIAGWVARHKRPLLIPDCYLDPRFNPEYDKKSKFKTKSMICVPMVRKNKLLGVIEVINKKNDGIFSLEDLALFETLASQCAIAIENHQLTEQQVETEALERELDTAREIQQNLLPEKLPTYDDIQVAARLIPAKQVGGDYYDVIRIDSNYTLLFVADVTGKGIPAALIVSTLHACIHSYFEMNSSQFDLLTLVQGLNRVLIESTTVTKFVTAWFGLYDHRTRRLNSINAGHNLPYLFKDETSEPIVFETGGLFLGSLDMPYEMEEIQLEIGDCLVYFSDGVTEAWNLQEEEYGEDRLIRTVRERLSQSADELLETIIMDIQDHAGKAPQSDDITCGIFRILNGVDEN